MDSVKRLENFDRSEFLKSIWQKKHLLIQQGLPSLSLDFDQNDLAGLSLEECIDSRIVKEPNKGEYEFCAGPFVEEDFQKLNQCPWTLLVQSVDHFVPDMKAIKDYFDFIPAWRLDDVMVSYATEGGSVGPHFDYYDVFLIQLQGQRNWKIGQMCDENSALQPHADLKLLESFDEQADLMLQPGDILYVPPGLAHWGIAASDDCMTISVGFRAPSYTDVIMSVADDVMATTSQDFRYCDADLSEVFTAGDNSQHEISSDVVKQVQAQLMTLAMDKKRIAKVFGKLMTEAAFFDPSETDGSESVPKKISRSLLEKHLDSRMAYTKADNEILLFANGETIELPLSELEFVEQLCVSDELDLEQVTEQQQEVVGRLINLNIYDIDELD